MVIAMSFATLTAELSLRLTLPGKQHKALSHCRLALAPPPLARVLRSELTLASIHSSRLLREGDPGEPANLPELRQRGNSSFQRIFVMC